MMAQLQPTHTAEDLRTEELERLNMKTRKYYVELVIA